MFTLFTIPKSFRGHSNIIQCNAIKSWTLLRPACEILLFGDDEGTGEVAREFNLRHIPQVARNEYGTPLLNNLFEQAQHLATHDWLCYVNADIILMSDFMQSVVPIVSHNHRFLIVGQRWDADVKGLIDFHSSWEKQFRTEVSQNGKLHSPDGIDYFTFPRDLWGEIPAFAIGRTIWDNWFIYRVRSLRLPVIDATATITVVHQNHDYGHHPKGFDGVWKGPEADLNLRLAGGRKHVFTLRDANWVLTSRGLRRPNLTRARLYRQLETQGVLRPNLGPWPGLAKRLLTPRSLVRSIMKRVK